MLTSEDKTPTLSDLSPNDDLKKRALTRSRRGAPEFKLSPSLGAEVIDALEALLPEGQSLGDVGVLAGQSVCSVIMELAGLERGPINDIDLFMIKRRLNTQLCRESAGALQEEQLGEQTVDFTFAYPNMPPIERLSSDRLSSIPKLVNGSTPPKTLVARLPSLRTVWSYTPSSPHSSTRLRMSHGALPQGARSSKEAARAGQDHYLYPASKMVKREARFDLGNLFHLHLHLQGKGLYELISTDREGLINYIVGQSCHESRVHIRLISILKTFDINCTQVGVDLSSKELVWTEAFAHFLRSFELELCAVSHPCHTAIRWFEKKIALDAYGDDDAVMSALSLSMKYARSKSVSLYRHPMNPSGDGPVEYSELATHLSQGTGQKDRPQWSQTLKVIFTDRYRERFEAIESTLSPWFRLVEIESEGPPLPLPLYTLKPKNEPILEHQSKLIAHLIGEARWGIFSELTFAPRLIIDETSNRYTRAQRRLKVRLIEQASHRPYACALVFGALYAEGRWVLEEDIKNSDLDRIERAFIRHPNAVMKLAHLSPKRLSACLLYLQRLEKKVGEMVWGLVESELEYDSVENEEELERALYKIYSALIELEIQGIGAQNAEIEEPSQGSRDLATLIIGHVKESDPKSLGQPVLITENGVECFELKGSAMLEREGREMRHCVGGYAMKSALKRCLIFSLRRTSERSYESTIRQAPKTIPSTERIDCRSTLELIPTFPLPEERALGVSVSYKVNQHCKAFNQDPSLDHQEAALQLIETLKLASIEPSRRAEAGETLKLMSLEAGYERAKNNILKSGAQLRQKIMALPESITGEVTRAGRKTLNDLKSLSLSHLKVCAGRYEGADRERILQASEIISAWVEAHWPSQPDEPSDFEITF